MRPVVEGLEGEEGRGEQRGESVEDVERAAREVDKDEHPQASRSLTQFMIQDVEFSSKGDSKPRKLSKLFLTTLKRVNKCKCRNFEKLSPVPESANPR